jgi:hypothetical protein
MLKIKKICQGNMIALMLLCFSLATVGIAIAAVTVASNGVQKGATEVIDFNNRAGINWNYDGFTTHVSGINWQDFHALAITYGDHSGINWQSIPGS